VIRSFVKTLAEGFLMGSAALVPGVSGGTIALVLGIYERLIDSIREGSSSLGALVKGDLKGFSQHFRQVEWPFLLSLIAGILLALVLLAAFLQSQLEERPTALAAAFFGLVVGSVVVAWRLLKSPRPVHFVIAAVVGVGLFVLLGLGGTSEVTDPGLIAFFGAGALAIGAMILPGISGSLLLVLVGMYAAVLAAFNDRDLQSFAVFALGAIIGLALFSQILHWALEHHHDFLLAGLIGLMAGSLRILWPWPDGVGSATLAAPGDDWGVALLASVVGLGAVFAISRIGDARRGP
jgi:putative membrane protein